MEKSISNQKTKSSNIEAFIFIGVLLFGFFLCGKYYGCWYNV